MVNGYGPYYEEVENHWTEDGSRQKVIRYLGRNPGRGTANNGGTSQDANPGSGKDGALNDDKQGARQDIDKSKRDIDEALARNEAERKIIDDSDAPESRKEEVEKRRTEKAAREIKAAKDKAQRSLDDYHKDELEASKRNHDKWSPQRKKEAQEISRRVGCSPIQADALNQRAKRAGQSYDTVDWDQVQGKDLTYPERVGKLDQTVGRRTRTKGEADRGARDFDQAVTKWERDPARYQGEMESASREYFYDMKAEVY
jgi:hypothetical protein